MNELKKANSKVGKRLMVAGLIACGITFCVAVYSTVKANSITNKVVALAELCEFEAQILLIGQELDTPIPLRKVTDFSPEGPLVRCIALLQKYDNVRKQLDNLTAQQAVRNAAHTRETFKAWSVLCGVLFLFSLITFKVGADMWDPPLREQNLHYWLMDREYERSNLKC